MMQRDVPAFAAAGSYSAMDERRVAKVMLNIKLMAA